MSTFLPEITTVADWLLTFALHSTVALGAAWLASVALGRRALTLQETLLRWSLWVALASSLLSVALQSPFGGSFLLPGTAAATEAGEVHELVSLLGASALPAEVATPSLWSRWSWQELVLAGAGLAGAIGLVWLATVHRRLRVVLAARQPETDPRVLGVAAEVATSLGLQQSPHVSRSARIATPIAFGLVRPEICLPLRAGELGDASLRAMLAHEVAHLRAADPAWMWGAAWLQAMFPWQLLLVAVRRRWARLVELRCDSIAANEATPTAVARCLLDVAGWLQPRSAPTIVALGMAARPSALRERVEAALRGEPFRPLRRRASLSVGGVFCAALSIVAPGVATESAPVGVDAVAAGPTVTSQSPSPHAATLVALAAAVQIEHAELVAEAAGLRQPTGLVAQDSELATLQIAIDRRLQLLQEMRARLEALLARTEANHR